MGGGAVPSKGPTRSTWPEDVPIEDCASFFVNPYTAVGILDTAQRAGSSRAIAHTTAASQLGQMLNKLAAKGMEIIDVVEVSGTEGGIGKAGGQAHRRDNGWG